MVIARLVTLLLPVRLTPAPAETARFVTVRPPAVVVTELPVMRCQLVPTLALEEAVISMAPVEVEPNSNTFAVMRPISVAEISMVLAVPGFVPMTIPVFAARGRRMARPAVVAVKAPVASSENSLVCNVSVPPLELIVADVPIVVAPATSADNDIPEVVRLLELLSVRLLSAVSEIVPADEVILAPIPIKTSRPTSTTIAPLDVLIAAFGLSVRSRPAVRFNGLLLAAVSEAFVPARMSCPATRSI